MSGIIAVVLAVLALFNQAQAMAPTPAPAPPIASSVTLAPVAPCDYAQPIVVVNPELQDVTVRAIERLTEILGCVPFTLGPSHLQIQFASEWFTDTFDPSGFDWTWVMAAAAGAPGWPDMGKWNGIPINPHCWERVTGDWSIVIAHELGHHLGWADMDGHPYMTCPLISGTWYRADLVVVCGP